MRTESRGQFVQGPESDDVFSLKVLVKIMRKWLWVIVLVVTLFTGVAVGNASIQEPVYQSSITMLVGEKRGLAAAPQDAAALQTLTVTMAEGVRSRRVAEPVVDRLGLRMSPDALLGSLEVEALPETLFVRISYSDTDPATAKRVVEAVGSEFSEQIFEARADNSIITATVWDQAALPEAPISPNPERSGFLALMLGCFVGVGLALLLEHMQDGWRSPEEAEMVSGFRTLTVIPEFDAVGPRRGAGSTR
jgi:capsular polysaccharide biosynthesis protein